MKETYIRLDQLLFSRGLVKSRTYAKDLIKTGNVVYNKQVAKKANALVQTDCDIELLGQTDNWVSRGGAKLSGALKHFSVDAKGKTCLDIGASTGGFTDTLLKAGAKKVYAVDVGHSQLSNSIANDDRVVNLERTDARGLDAKIIEDPIDIGVCDVSFISLKKAIPPAMTLIKPGGNLICLLKPQFELGPGKLGKTGILLNSDLRNSILEQMEIWFSNISDWRLNGTVQSPLPGRGGNIEFFLWAHKLS